MGRFKDSWLILFGACLVVTLAMSLPVLSANPETLRYQARLTDDAGVWLTGEHDLGFAIFDSESGGTLLWSQPPQMLTLSNGAIDMVLGETGPVPSSVFVAAGRWIEVTVDGVVLGPRQRLTSVPYAHASDRLGDKTLAETLDRANHAGVQSPTTIAPQGAGSGLNADLLDGLDSLDLMSPSGSDVFTTPGTTSWTAPDSVRVVLVTLVGAGGGGGGGNNGPDDGTGGGGGATVINAPYVVVPGNTYSVVVGSGGDGGIHFGGAGQPGSASSFGNLSCPGGEGGISVGNGGPGGAGGTAPTNASHSQLDLDGNGTAGGGVPGFGEHFYPAPPVAIDGGSGGDEPPSQGSGGGGTPFGAGGMGQGSGTDGDPGSGFGGGGGGAGPVGDGGRGADGLVIVRY